MRKLLILLPIALIIAVIFIFSDTLLLPIRFTWHSNRAQFHEARKQYVKAIHEYNKAAEIYRERQILKHLLKVYRKDMERFSDEIRGATGPAGTEEKVLDILHRSPENPYTHILLAEFYLSRTFYPETRKNVRKALRLNPNIKKSITRSLARLEYEQRRDIPKAIMYLESFCKDDPVAVAQNRLLIKLYVLGGRADDKKHLISHFMSKHLRTKKPRLYESLGYAHLGLGEYSMASSVFLQAIRSGKASTDTMIGLLRADAHLMLMKADQIAPARPAEAEALVARAMQNKTSLWREAAAIIRKHNLRNALPDTPPEIHYILAKSYGEDGKVNLMTRELELAIEKHPDHFDSVAELEKIYTKQKNSGKLKKLRTLAQKHQTARFTVKDLKGTWNGRLFENGSALINDVKLLSGKVAVSIQARGTPAAGVPPLMALFINGRRIGTVPVERKIDWYTFEADVATGRHLLDIVFPNAARVGGEKRKLFINQVKIRRK